MTGTMADNDTAHGDGCCSPTEAEPDYRSSSGVVYPRY